MIQEYFEKYWYNDVVKYKTSILSLTFVLAQGQVHNLYCNAITDRILNIFTKINTCTLYKITDMELTHS